MAYLLPVFKIVSVTFAVAAVATGAQAVIDPVGFSKSFGLPIIAIAPRFTKDADEKVKSRTTTTPSHDDNPATSYVALMGVRQLGTGIMLLIFAYQEKWSEAAIILSLIGILVAGTDGYHLARSGAKRQGLVHAIPGALIAALAGGAIYLKG